MFFVSYSSLGSGVCSPMQIIFGLKRDRSRFVFTHFSSRHIRRGLQTAQAAALGNTAIYLVERTTCVTVYTTAAGIVVAFSDPVAAMLALPKLLCCDCYYVGSYVLLMKS